MSGNKRQWENVDSDADIATKQKLVKQNRGEESKDKKRNKHPPLHDMSLRDTSLHDIKEKR